MEKISLEPEAAKVCKDRSSLPPVFQLPPAKGREALENAQNAPVYMYPARVQDIVANAGEWGELKIFSVSPESVSNPANIIFYIHGGGWVFGSFHTHEKLVRELAARTGSVVIFPEYSRSPEAPYPKALEQCYCMLGMLPQLTKQFGFEMNPATLTIAGDSAGGNIAAAAALLSKYRSGPSIQKLLLYYPVTNACFRTNSYQQFAEGYCLGRAEMIWFWNQYAKTWQVRNQIVVSPLRAGLEQLAGLPDTMIITGEADVLRDEGEAFARKLRAAKVNVTAVRFQAAVHDFVMQNALDQTMACRAAMDISTAWIDRKNWETVVCSEPE